MRMTSCDQCGDIISKSVEVCENCGTQNTTRDSSSILGIAAVLIPLLGLIIALKIMIN